MLWIAYYVVRECQDAGLLSLRERTDLFDVGRELRIALLGLLLLIAGGARFPVATRRSSLRSQVISGLAIVAGALLAFLLYWDEMTIPFLVHVACEGIEAASMSPHRVAPLTKVPSLAERYQPFVWGSAVAVCLGLFNLVLVWRLAMRWPRFLWPKTALFAIGFLLLCAVEYRLARTAFPKASPYLAANMQPGPAHYWIVAALVVGVGLTASTYRSCARPWDSQGGTNIAWRASRGYLHERMPWMILLAVAMIGAIIEDAIRLYDWFGSFQVVVYLFLNGSIYEPANILSVALFLFAMGRLLRASWGRPPVASGVAALDPLQYMVVWCLSFMLAPTVLAAIASFSFAPWLTTWVF